MQAFWAAADRKGRTPLAYRLRSCASGAWFLTLRTFSGGRGPRAAYVVKLFSREMSWVAGRPRRPLLPQTTSSMGSSFALYLRWGEGVGWATRRVVHAFKPGGKAFPRNAPARPDARLSGCYDDRSCWLRGTPNRRRSSFPQREPTGTASSGVLGRLQQSSQEREQSVLAPQG